MARRATDQADAQREPDEQGRAPLAALRPLLPLLLAYRARLALALAALLGASAATLLLPVAVRRVIDNGFSGEAAGVIDTYFVALVGVAALLALSSSARFYLVVTIGERVVADLRARVFAHLAALDPGFFDRSRTGELVSRLSADTTQIKSAFGASASIALRNALLFTGATAMMVVTSPRLSALVLLAIPAIVLPLVLSGRSVRRRARAAQDRLAEASAFATEAVGAVRIVQAYGAEGRAAATYAGAAEAAYTAAREVTAGRALLSGVAIFLVSATIVGVLWVGAQEVLAGTLTGGRLSQFVLYAVFAGSSLGQLSEVYGEVSQAAGAAARLADILATKPAIAAPERPVALPHPPRGEVAFESVSFAYPTRPDRSALRGLSFRVAPGERVAIVGPSGAGKTSIVQLLLRFYDPQTGRVLIDGVDLTQADPAQARARVAFVPQDPVVFGASIADNIRYARPEASDAEVEEAARLAAAHEFVARLPEGYATLAGERGVQLSGGQRQRLALARAILKDAPILLLDEATSALDASSERLVQDALECVMQGRTTLVIAHRLATVLSADRILVLDEGRLAEEGTHASLIARGGLYAKLARLQFEVGAQALRETLPAA